MFKNAMFLILGLQFSPLLFLQRADSSFPWLPLLPPLVTAR